MREYIKPQIDIKRFNNNDIVITSGIADAVGKDAYTESVSYDTLIKNKNTAINSLEFK